jgi:HEAT repeat protein
MILFGLIPLLAGGCGEPGSSVPAEILAKANRDSARQRTTFVSTASSITVDRISTRRADESLEQSAAVALARIGQPAVGSLRAALRDPQLEVRLRACAILGGIGPTAAEAVDDLVAIVADRNQPEELRKAAAQALGEIGPQAAGAVPVLVDVIRENS